MRLHFQTEQWLPVPLPEVFAFFANPANLPPLMPGWQKARIDGAALRPATGAPDSAPHGIAAGDGTELTITARAIPFLPFRGVWLAHIEKFRWNEGFCDVQLKGPFRYWRHCHSVEAAPEPGNGSRSGTLVRDHVEYELPVINSRILNRWLVLPALRRLFECRQRQAERLLV